MALVVLGVGFGVVGVALTYKRTKRRKARFDAAYI